MRQVRTGVFETNSSSTHSLTIVSKEDFEAWEEGKMILDEDDSLMTIEEACKDVNECRVRWKEEPYNFKDMDESEMLEILEDHEYKTYDKWGNNDYLEAFVDYHTTKSGDEIVVFGEYGYNG